MLSILPRTVRARLVQPNDGEDDGDEEVGAELRPILRQRGGKGHPQGDLRQRNQHIDNAHDHFIDHTAKEAGKAAQQQPEYEGCEDADEADGEGNAPTKEDTREQIAAKAIRTQDEKRDYLLFLGLLCQTGEYLKESGPTSCTDRL